MSFKDGVPMCPHHGGGVSVRDGWYVCIKCGPYRQVKDGDGEEE